MTDNAGKRSAIVKLTAQPGRRDDFAAAFGEARPLGDALAPGGFELHDTTPTRAKGIDT
jgi:hypothetical protein